MTTSRLITYGPNPSRTLTGRMIMVPRRGIATRRVHPLPFSFVEMALMQLLATVGGHLLGIVVAHERALRRLPPGRALVGQLPLLVMVAATPAVGRRCPLPLNAR